MGLNRKGCAHKLGPVPDRGGRPHRNERELRAAGRGGPTSPRGSAPRTRGRRAVGWGCCMTAGAPGSRSHSSCCTETTGSRGSSLRSWGEKRSGHRAGLAEPIPGCARLQLTSGVPPTPPWTVGVQLAGESRRQRTQPGGPCPWKSRPRGGGGLLLGT